MHTRALLFSLAAPLLVGSTGSAQNASALLREGDALVGAPPGHVVTSLNSSNTNAQGGYVVGLSSSDGVLTLSHAWGSADGTGPGILQTEGNPGGLLQSSFESFLGLANDGAVCYSATVTGGIHTGDDSAWLGNTPVAIEQDPIATLPGKFFSFASRPSVTADGVPYFVGGITSFAGGATESRALFFGGVPGALLQGGDVLPNLPEPLSTSNTVSFDYRLSSLGTNSIVEVEMSGPSVTSSSNNAMVISGSGLILGGSLVQEGLTIPVGVGGDGAEAWDNFDFMGVTEAGEYFFSGDTDGGSATDEFIVQNGVVRFREGDTVDARVLAGSIEAAFMNEAGQLMYVWDVEDGGGGSDEALFFEDQLLLVVGDEVDWDGDGNLDAGFVVAGFTGIAAASLGSDGTLYFTADVDTNGGGLLEGFFAFYPGSPPFGSTYCLGDGSGTACPCGNLGGTGHGCANSSGNGALLVGAGSLSVAADDVVFSLAQGPAHVPAIVFTGTAQANGGAGSLFGDGLLCASGMIQRLHVVFLDGAGGGSWGPGLQPQGGWLASDTRHVQGWYRDVSGPCNGGFNTSQALSVTFEP